MRNFLDNKDRVYALYQSTGLLLSKVKTSWKEIQLTVAERNLHSCPAQIPPENISSDSSVLLSYKQNTLS